MMWIETTGGDKIAISFERIAWVRRVGKTTVGTPRVVGRRALAQSTTRCRVVFRTQHSEHAYLGISHCSVSDREDRAVGRKLAMARALAGLPRLVRGQIWEAYRAARAAKPTPERVDA